MEKLTPLMSQYRVIKKKYEDAILFFRLGDFYEMFGDDARMASEILDITLTSRQKVPMCGVPYHSSGGYIAKLIRKGKKVAICEQVEDPKKAQGIVKREVVRLVTPGTVFEENLLQEKENNYLASIYPEKENIGIAMVDISTGEFLLTEFERISCAAELARFPVSEIIMPSSKEKASSFDVSCPEWHVNKVDEWYYQHEEASDKIMVSFGLGSLKGLGLAEHRLAVSAAGAILRYLEDTQKGALSHLQKPRYFDRSEYMIIDSSTQKNLELVSNQRDNTRQGSLLEVMDITRTSGGARLLRRYLLQPLKDIKEITKRLDIVDSLISKTFIRERCQDILKRSCDLERLIARLNTSSGNARDLVSLKRSLELIPEIKKVTQDSGDDILLEAFGGLYHLEDVIGVLNESLVEDAPVTVKEGGMIKPSYDKELARLNSLTQGGKDWIAELEKKEKARTGISSLKVGFTSVFGYYIEVTKANLSQVPADYIRKQTLVNSERFVTPELKEREAEILGAEEKKNELEYELFLKIKSEVVSNTSRIQKNAEIMNRIDVFCALALLASSNNYVRPEINDSLCINIEEGRHPVVERIFSEKVFVPNDVYIDSSLSQILVITGPNMSGKSTFIRQVALITIMAQMGSFVPARIASIGVVDRVFTRIGTSDNLYQGESTFMVEMMEVANIVNNYSSRSLLILDEVGRGTSTFDGISIAWSVLEYLHRSEQGPRTLFATHYFELTGLAGTLGRIKNYNVTVKEWNDQIMFLHKIEEGSADKSYGIYVAQLAGLPETVIERAKYILRELEENSIKENEKLKISSSGPPAEVQQLSFFVNPAQPVLDEIKKLDIDRMTPVDALQTISRWKEILKHE